MELKFIKCIYASKTDKENPVYNIVYTVLLGNDELIYKGMAVEEHLYNHSLWGQSIVTLINEEYVFLEASWTKNNDYFIKPIQKYQVYLQFDSTTHEKINIFGKFFVYGFFMEKMENDYYNRFIYDKKTPLTDEEFFRLFHRLINMFSDLQSIGLSHRDIKPQNIFIDKRGVTKLGDVGTSKKVNYWSKKEQDYYNYIKSLEQFSTVVGTPSYMAPEIFNEYLRQKSENQKSSNFKYDPFRADLYSLGKTLLDIYSRRVISFNPEVLENEDKFYYFLEQNLKTIKNERISYCIGIMMTYNSQKRPDFDSFKKEFFDIIFKEEINRIILNQSFMFENKQDFDEDNTTIRLPNSNVTNYSVQSKPIDQDDFNQILISFNDMDLKTSDLVEFKYIQPGDIKFNVSGDHSDPNKDLLIKSGHFYSLYQTKYKEKDVFVQKFNFASQTKMKKKFEQELNFILNRVNSDRINVLVKYLGLIETNNDFVYLVSEKVNIPKTFNKEIKNNLNERLSTLYNLEDIFKSLKKPEDFVTFFSKGNHKDVSIEKEMCKIKLMILWQLLKAVEYLKSKGVSFVNLSLKNILIEKNDHSFKIKLRNYCLFDTCYHLQHSSKCSSYFAESNGFFCWPPEFFDDYIDTDKSDMWALGVCIHQIFSQAQLPWLVTCLGDYLVEVVFPASPKLNLKIIDPINGKIKRIVLGLIEKDFTKRKDLDWVKNQLEMDIV